MELNNIQEFQILEPVEDFQNYSNNLGVLGELITEFTVDSEKTFLEIGNKLRSFLTTSRSSAQLAGKAADAISDEILQKGINELNGFLTDFGSYLQTSINEIINDKHELHKIIPNIESINLQLAGFDKIVKQLRMLGISTKIESARLGSEDHGFYALAETVDRLAGLITEKAVTILKKSSVLIDELNKTIANLEKLEREQHEQSESIIQNSKKSLQTFNLKYAERVEKSEKISVSSKKVSDNINEIVMSIQFHDITRQRMEHVKHALDDAAEQLRKYINAGNDAGAVPLFETVYDVCGLQIVQLKSSVEEFNDAVFSILNNLKSVGENVSQILAETTTLLDENDLSKKSSLKKVQEELKAISVGLNKNMEIDKELSESINAVVSVVDDLSNYVLEIEDIGSEIEIIALNARVKAAHTGSNGSALGVLSETIQRLSVAAKSQTTTTSEILNRISVDSKNLRISVESGAYKEENTRMISTADRINDLTGTLIELEKEAEKFLDGLTHSIGSLREEIFNTVDKVTVPKYAEMTLEKSISGLNEIITDIAHKGIVSSDREVNTKELMRKYTMKTERKIHQNFTGRHQDERETGLNNTAGGSDDSLGENVELF